MSLGILATMGLVLWITFAVLCSLFPLTYAVNRWYRTPEGRGIMLFAIAVAVIVDLVVLFRFVDEPRHVLLWVQLMALTYANVAAAYKLAVLWKAHIRAIRSKPGRYDSP